MPPACRSLIDINDRHAACRNLSNATHGRQSGAERTTVLLRIASYVVLVALGATLWVLGAAPAAAHVINGASLSRSEISTSISARSVESRLSKLGSSAQHRIVAGGANSCGCCHADSGAAMNGSCSAACAGGLCVEASPPALPLPAELRMFSFSPLRLESTGTAPAEKPPRA